MTISFLIDSFLVALLSVSLFSQQQKGGGGRVLELVNGGFEEHQIIGALAEPRQSLVSQSLHQSDLLLRVDEFELG